MPGVIQVHIGDQHADAANPDLDWLDGSVMTAYDEYRSLLNACEVLMASLQHPERGAAHFNRTTSNVTERQFADLRTNWFDIRRNGNNTITPTLVQIDQWYADATTITAGNDLIVGPTTVDRITRSKYDTFNPSQWGRVGDKSKFLYITLDRDLTRREVNTWGGKHTAAVVEDEPEDEHNPMWVNYDVDLAAENHAVKRSKVVEVPSRADKADIRDKRMIIDIATGRPDTIVRTRTREDNGSVVLPNRIDEEPVRPTRR
jgi:hypothetical protein